MLARRALFLPILLLALLAGTTVLVAVMHLRDLRDTRGWTLHSHEVIETAQATFSDVQDVESGQRGYMIYGDPRFLDNYQVALEQAPRQLQHLRELTRDNPAQAARVERLGRAIDQRIAVSKMRVDLIRAGKPTEARQANFLAGKTSMEQARAAMAELMAAERSLLAERSRQSDRAQLFGVGLVLAVAAVAAVGVGLALMALYRAYRRLEQESAEKERLEAARREADALYRAFFDASTDYLFVNDLHPDGTITVGDINRAFAKISGYEAEAVRGRPLTEVIKGQRGQDLANYYREVASAGKPLTVRHEPASPTGTRVWDTALVPVEDESGRVARIIGSSRDITDRVRAEEQLQRAQRMEAVGQLTGGVAHDFNNLLQVIRGNLEMIAPKVKDNEALSRRLQNALHGADRAAQLTRQLLAFARRQPLEPKVVNLGRLVSDMTDMLRRTLGEAVEVETVVAGGLWNTLADPAQVESAILNLAINARDAMPGGGKLTVEVTNASLDAAYAQRDQDINPGQYVLIAVSDTGEGMSPETLKRVFEPFFTTKSEEKGTGLGLSMVYGFVKQSNGHVQIYSEVGHGTTVKIYLPRSRRDEDIKEEPDRDLSVEGRSEVILVVEDEDLVRSAAVGILRDLGYTCLHAHDAATALAMLEGGTKVDLLFTDVIMPGPVKSRDMAARAQEIRPGLPVLFTSGYTENSIVHHGRLDEGVELLSKPYGRDALARRVRAMLDRARPVVFLVEDDGLVRMSAVDMVEQLGFTVREFGEAGPALEALEKGDRADILLTDIGLPGMRGPELAQKARALRSGLKIVFASGYGEQEETAAIENTRTLSKPYSKEDLASALDS